MERLTDPNANYRSLTDWSEEAIRLVRKEVIENQHLKSVLKKYENIGKTPKQLAEWAKAEQEGRLVVLPCKDGDTVKANVLRPYNGNTLTIHGEVVDIETVIRVRYNQDRYIDFLIEDFGKTVFLTPEAAKEAMRKNKCEKCGFCWENNGTCQGKECRKEAADAALGG